MSRLRRLVMAAALVVVVAACDVDITVDVDVARDGSGVVEVVVVLDDEAAARIPELADLLRTDDLVEAGWQIDGPVDTVDDGFELVARKPFASPDQLQPVLDEITGPDGAFRDFALSRATEFAEVDLSLSGVVDLSRGVELFSDAELTEALDGRPLGIDLAALEAEIGPIADAVELTFEAHLPATNGDDAEISVSPALGDDPVPVAVAATDEDELARILRLVGWAAAILAGVAMLVNVVIWTVEWRRRRAEPDIRTPDPLRPIPAVAAAGAPVVAERVPPVAPATPAAAPQVGGRRVAVVVVDAYGVLYEPLLGPLVRFAQARGSTLEVDEIARRYDEAAEGRCTTAELWVDLGVPGDPTELDVSFLRHVRMRAGARDFVRELQRRGLSVCAVGNTVGAWSEGLRSRDKLAGIEPWINSSDAGVRSPHPGLFEALRRATGIPFEEWLMIHADLESLDAARTLGMNTVWFARELPPANQRPAHSVVTGFADFFRRRR